METLIAYVYAKIIRSWYDGTKYDGVDAQNETHRIQRIKVTRNALSEVYLFFPPDSEVQKLINGLAGLRRSKDFVDLWHRIPEGLRPMLAKNTSMVNEFARYAAKLLIDAQNRDASIAELHNQFSPTVAGMLQNGWRAG